MLVAVDLLGTTIDEHRITLPGNLGSDFAFFARIDNIVLDKMITPQLIPEPSTMLLLGSGLVGLSGYRWKKAQA